MDLPEFTDHYTIVETDGDHIHHTWEAVQAAAEGDPRRIWFVREGDDEGCECAEDDGECECDLDTVWTVEAWGGQFVNRVGFFVSTEPRKPEHDDTIFAY